MVERTLPADLPATPALTAWLEQHVARFRGPIALTKFEGGQSNPTYRLDAANGAYVLRRKPFGSLLPSAHAVDREYRVLSALYPLGFPVPRVLALCEDDRIIGSAFYVMALVAGANFTEGALPGTTKEARTKIYYAMIDTLAALHRIDVEAAGLSSFGRPGTARDFRALGRQGRDLVISRRERGGRFKVGGDLGRVGFGHVVVSW